ncbi:MAG: GNAT family N-acetyltransferase [Alphaproteobacteria bacterium]
MSSVAVRVLTGLREVSPDTWDALANPDPGRFNPFVSHAFLFALEESQSATPEAGWTPQHLVIAGKNGLAAAMPLYRKSHSLGEYVFDHGWANAYAQAGGRYYPKLQCAVPFTPVTGPRLLVGTGDRSEGFERALVAGAQELARRSGASSLHITVPTGGEWQRLGSAGLLQRTDQQFVWENRGYQTFDDFLADLASRKRKAIRREREEVRGAGIEIAQVTGRDLTEKHWDDFFAFYMETGSRKWGSPYLTRAFFSLVGERMRERILLILALREGRVIGGALNFIGGDTLFGRYWGAREHHPFLHFEVCYYQAIEYAIAHGLKCVEAGAQGEHKLARGYLPKCTYSLHWIADPGFAAAVARYLKEERRAVAEQIDELSQAGPFKHEDDHGL